MEENKKNTGLVLLIIVLLVVVMALAGFIVYDKVLTKDAEVSKSDNNNSSQKVVVSKQDIEELMKIVDVIPESNGLTVEDLKNISYAEKINLVATLSNKKIEGLSEKEIKEGLTKFFGSDLNITTMEDIMCDCGKAIFKYDQSKGMYVYNEEHPGHGAGGGNAFLETYDFFESYEVEGNKVKVNVKKLFEGSSGDVYRGLVDYYLTYEDAKNHKNMKTLPEEMQERSFEYEEVYEIEKDNLPVYTYVFEKVDDNYRFVNYTINKNA